MLLTNVQTVCRLRSDLGELYQNTTHACALFHRLIFELILFRHPVLLYLYEQQRICVADIADAFYCNMYEIILYNLSSSSPLKSPPIKDIRKLSRLRLLAYTNDSAAAAHQIEERIHLLALSNFALTTTGYNDYDDAHRCQGGIITEFDRVYANAYTHIMTLSVKQQKKIATNDGGNKEYSDDDDVALVDKYVRAINNSLTNSIYYCKRCKRSDTLDITTRQIRALDEAESIFAYCKVCEIGFRVA